MYTPGSFWHYTDGSCGYSLDFRERDIKQEYPASFSVIIATLSSILAKYRSAAFWTNLIC